MGWNKEEGGRRGRERRGEEDRDGEKEGEGTHAVVARMLTSNVSVVCTRCEEKKATQRTHQC